MVNALLDLLLRKGIRRLVDVRCNPVARRYGYHKATLCRLGGNPISDKALSELLHISSDDLNGKPPARTPLGWLLETETIAISRSTFIRGTARHAGSKPLASSPTICPLRKATDGCL